MSYRIVNIKPIMPYQYVCVCFHGMRNWSVRKNAFHSIDTHRVFLLCEFECVSLSCLRIVSCKDMSEIIRAVMIKKSIYNLYLLNWRVNKEEWKSLNNPSFKRTWTSVIREVQTNDIFYHILVDSSLSIPEPLKANKSMLNNFKSWN